MFFFFFMVHIGVVTWMAIAPPVIEGSAEGEPAVNWTGWMTAVEFWRVRDQSSKYEVAGALSLRCVWFCASSSFEASEKQGGARCVQRYCTPLARAGGPPPCCSASSSSAVSTSSSAAPPPHELAAATHGRGKVCYVARSVCGAARPLAPTAWSARKTVLFSSAHGGAWRSHLRQCGLGSCACTVRQRSGVL